EFVAALRHCPDVPRRRGIVAERRADLGDAEVEAAIEVDERLVLPDGLPELLARDRSSRVLDQRPQHLRGLRLQLDGAAVTRQLEAVGIECKDAETSDRGDGDLLSAEYV